MPEYYEIKIEGYVNPPWSDWFAGLELTQLDKNVTLLSGPLADQAALYGVLRRIRDLNLTLISVTSKPPAINSNKKGKSHEDN